MRVDELIDKTGWTCVAGQPTDSITSAYVCDLLSWVMAHGQRGTVWVTIQTHMNVIAVASLHNFSCVVIPENVQLSQETIAAANDKDVCILSAPCSSYGAAKMMADLGISEVDS